MIYGGGRVGEQWYESFRVKKGISLSVLPADLSNLAIFSGHGSFCPGDIHLDRIFSRSQSVAFRYSPCFVMLQIKFSQNMETHKKQVDMNWHSLCVIARHV